MASGESRSLSPFTKVGGASQGLDVGSMGGTARGADLDADRRAELVMPETGHQPIDHRHRVAQVGVQQKHPHASVLAFRDKIGFTQVAADEPRKLADDARAVVSSCRRVRKFCARTARFSSFLKTKSKASSVTTRELSSRNGSLAITASCPVPRA